MREFSHVFNDSYLTFQDDTMAVDGSIKSELKLLAIPTNQKAREDLVAVGDHIEAEKDRLLNVVSVNSTSIKMFLFLGSIVLTAFTLDYSQVHGIWQVHLSTASKQRLLGRLH
jgi:hypothetical protein